MAGTTNGESFGEVPNGSGGLNSIFVPSKRGLWGILSREISCFVFEEF